MSCINIIVAILFLLALPSLSWAADFELVATHPSAVNTSSDWGKTLHGGYLFEGKLYWGYGDWYKNTGKVDIIPFDPQTGSFLTKEFTAETEGIHDFRAINNKLYVPHVDPANYFINQDYSRKDSAGWHQVKVGLYHVFDIQEFQGSFYLVGSKYGNNTGTPGKAVVYKSATGREDGYQEVLTESNPNSTPRYFFSFVFNNKLYVQSQLSNRSKVYDGNNANQWTDGPNLLPNGGEGSNSNAFAGKIVYQAVSAIPVFGGGPLYVFDGTQATSVRSKVVKYTFSGNTLYAIEENGNIVKTTNLLDWTTVGTFPSGLGTSIVIAGDRMYLGTRTSQVFRSTFLVSSAPSISITPSLTPQISSIVSPIPIPSQPEETPTPALIPAAIQFMGIKLGRLNTIQPLQIWINVLLKIFTL